MAGDERQHEAVRRQFGARAPQYVVSEVHASGADLAQLRRWADGGPEKSLLDIATGGGHTALALAPKFGTVVATDITEPMLAAASEFVAGQGAANVKFQVADSQNLPFEPDSFDCLSCRIAPHHFSRPSLFVLEARRVLKPGGIFLLEDSIVPDDEALALALSTRPRSCAIPAMSAASRARSGLRC